MTSVRRVGRLLCVPQIAAGLRAEEAAIHADISLERLRELEGGLIPLGSLEGLLLAKTLLLRPSWPARHLRAGSVRDGGHRPSEPRWAR